MLGSLKFFARGLWQDLVSDTPTDVPAVLAWPPEAKTLHGIRGGWPVQPRQTPITRLTRLEWGRLYTEAILGATLAALAGRDFVSSMLR
jgi:hypothetical protein